ncbi:hypothetical protein DF3PB_10085 [uncultured Defluviicoccus sp.]|uniref:Uncharacterized protein n=1 Tax=metagenome TaxID=256318 RepID=A0A380T9L0_9ZZZZ|nr:hypothetical protein DF3PB_10085 [uncultured Defluviicoccus sp.]
MPLRSRSTRHSKVYRDPIVDRLYSRCGPGGLLRKVTLEPSANLSFQPHGVADDDDSYAIGIQVCLPLKSIFDLLLHISNLDMSFDLDKTGQRSNAGHGAHLFFRGLALELPIHVACQCHMAIRDFGLHGILGNARVPINDVGDPGRDGLIRIGGGERPDLQLLDVSAHAFHAFDRCFDIEFLPERCHVAGEADDAVFNRNSNVVCVERGIPVQFSLHESLQSLVIHGNLLCVTAQELVQSLQSRAAPLSLIGIKIGAWHRSRNWLPAGIGF